MLIIIVTENVGSHLIYFSGAYIRTQHGYRVTTENDSRFTIEHEHEKIENENRKTFLADAAVCVRPSSETSRRSFQIHILSPSFLKIDNIYACSFQFGWLQTSRTAYHMFIIKCNLIYLSLVSSHRPEHGWLLSFSILFSFHFHFWNMCACVVAKDLTEIEWGFGAPAGCSVYFISEFWCDGGCLLSSIFVFQLEDAPSSLRDAKE